jgi:BirA family transcriptional regulator, biotin operon repressor / biotin---[acetyl-CoA-carboxylase] ligase
VSVAPAPPLGRPRVHLRRTDSTNLRARELAGVGAPHGTLVTAAEQTSGRGRQGRTWSAPPGSSLLMSLLLRSPPTLLPLIAAVAVCDVVGETARIKWPNDIVVPADTTGVEPALAKLAGILVEGRPQEGWAVLGIGLNVAVRLEDLPAELQGGSVDGETSEPPRLAATLGRSPDEIEPLLDRLLGALALRLAEPANATLEAWRARDALRGRQIAWSAGQGLAEGVDGEGRLVVTLRGGGHTTLSAGEVHLRTV